MSSAQPIGAQALRVEQLTKTFARNRALDAVDLEVRSGAIHALLGGNGSGKSTLIKALAGVQPADAGSITVNGRRFDAASLTPHSAALAGLRFVHQDIGIFADFSVEENIALASRYPGSRMAIDRKQLRQEARELLARFDIDADPGTLAGRLRPSTRTMVAIARALRDGSDTHDLVLVLDEPTASLPDHEVEVLLEAVRRRARLGQTIIYVSHRLPEVLAIADELTVLRDGKRVASVNATSVDERAIVKMIAGREIDSVYPNAGGSSQGRAILQVSELTAGPLQDVTLSVHSGEIVGVGGLTGSGRTSLLRAVFGDLAVERGTLEVDGAAGPFQSISAAVDAGVGLVPEDRGRDAAFLDLPVKENLSAAVIGDYYQRLFLRRRAEAEDALALTRRFKVKTASTAAVMSSLSGGNQQKVILARWLRRSPKLLLLDEPTQGVDVVARSEIYRLVREAADQGAAIMLASSDYEELAHLCDRVVVLRAGTVIGELRAPLLDVNTIIELANYSKQAVLQ